MSKGTSVNKREFIVELKAVIDKVTCGQSFAFDTRHYRIAGNYLEVDIRVTLKSGDGLDAKKNLRAVKAALDDNGFSYEVVDEKTPQPCVIVNPLQQALFEVVTDD